VYKEPAYQANKTQDFNEISKTMAK